MHGVGCRWRLLVGMMIVGVAVPSAIAAGGESYAPVPRVADLSVNELPDPRAAVEVAQARERGRKEAEQRQRRRSSAEEREARSVSRSAYRGRGRDAALGVARRELARLVDEPLWAPPKLAAGEQIVGYAGDHLIQIRRKGAKAGAAIYTPFPARVADENGDKRPMDLSLEERPDDFETKNSLVDVRLPKRLADGVTLGDTGVSVRPPVGDSVSTGVEQAGKVFWSDVATDTDFMVAPLPNGIETFHLLRSADAPQQLALMLDLPADATLRYARVPAVGFGPAPKANSGGVEILRGGEVVGTISPAVASDADGEPVDVQLRLGEGRVTLEVAHREADVKYPLTVDPVFVGYVRDDNTWRDGYPAFSGWQYTSNPSGYLAGFAGNSVWGNGLYVTATANAPYCCSHYGQWLYYAPGTSYIYRADLTGMYHHASGSTYYAGIAKTNVGWQRAWSTSSAMSNTYTTICVSDCGASGALPGNNFAFGQIMYGRTGASGAISYLGRVYLTLSDNDAPVITGVSPNGAPSGWTRPQDLATMSARVTATDTGLGIAAEDIMIGDTQVGPWVGIGCGDRNGRCPNNTDNMHPYDVSDYIADKPDGIHQVTARVADVVGRVTSSTPWPVKIDSSEPDVRLSGDLLGMAAKELSADSYKLIVDGDDSNPWGAERGSAGVKSVEVKLDGARAYYQEQAAQACPGTGCTMRREWEFRPFDQELTVGEHTLQVVVTDHAGNQHVEPSWKVRVVRGAMSSPRAGDVSEKRLKLRAVVKRPGYSSATFKYRRASTEGWTTIPAAHLKTTAGDDVSSTTQALTDGATQTLVWDVAATLQSDTPVQIRAHFDDDAGSPTNTVAASYKPNGLGADYAREQLGPGEVDLLTGNFLLSDDDVTIDSYASDLTVRRTYASRMAQPASGEPAGIFGPGWLASAPVDAAGADYVMLDDQTTSATVTLADTTTVQFAATSTGYEPQAGYEDLKLSKSTSPTKFTLTDTDANTTVFELVAGSSEYRPSSASPPGGETTTNYEYAVVGGDVRLTRVLAPRPAGVGSCQPLVAGCRELRFAYTAPGDSTATGDGQAQWGTYVGRLDSVTFGAGAGAGVGTSETVARYQYDDDGRLRAAWDPRVSPALKTTYDYDPSGRLVGTTPPGEQPWTLTYQTIPADPASNGRLRSVARTGPSGTATWTAIYDVPLSGADAPHAMSASDVDDWAQTDTPVDATAIFPPDQVPGSGTPSSYSRAKIHYLNGSGREVNTALPGAHITTSEYDEHHNVIRSLTAANRQRAMAVSDSAARAREIDTQNTYDSSGLELREQLEPRHEIRLANGTTAQARKHTTTTYDTDGLHLPTTIRAGARVDGQNTDSDVRTTTLAYDTTGKALRKPTATTIDPDGLNLTTRTAYDAGTGLEISRTLPAGNAEGSDARTTKTIYYTAAANPEDAACANTAAWANLVCKIKPATQPTGGLPAIPATKYEYNRLSQPTTITDTAGTHTRTATKSYDDAGRLLTESTTATSGTAVPTVTHGYSTTTGRETTLSTSNPAKTITHVHDSLGRQTSHTDAEGLTSTTTYDLLDRPVTINDGKATQTLSYDPTRGLLTSVTDPQVGELGATYDADGAIATKTYPNGLTATITTDETGERTKLRYLKADNCGATCEWLLSQAAVNIHGQQTWQTTSTQAGYLSTDDYTYDPAGRLKQTNDRPGSTAACTVTSYDYDDNSNRTRRQTFDPAAAGACQSTTPAGVHNTTHDQADRITTTGFDYDAFGRTLTVPATHAGGTQLTSTYHANDLARTLTQDGTTRTYTLDPSERVSSRDTTTASTTTTETYHYTDTADNGLDSPAWIAENTAGTSYTRMIEGPDGDLAAIRNAAGTRLQLTNLHDDVTAEASPEASSSQLTVLGDSDAFGSPRQQTDRRQAWLGAKQRPTELKTGIIAMGVRTYVPALGRFLQTDPVQGGSSNAYDYAYQDPVNVTDLDGRFPWVAAALVARVAYKGYRAYRAGRRVNPRVVHSAHHAFKGSPSARKVGRFRKHTQLNTWNARTGQASVRRRPFGRWYKIKRPTWKHHWHYRGRP